MELPHLRVQLLFGQAFRVDSDQPKGSRNVETLPALDRPLLAFGEEDAESAVARLREEFQRQGWRVMEPDPQPYYMKLFQSVPSEDWTGQKLDVTTWEDELGQFKQFIWGIKVFTALLVFILMVVIVIVAILGPGMMNAMLAVSVVVLPHYVRITRAAVITILPSPHPRS